PLPYGEQDAWANLGVPRPFANCFRRRCGRFTAWPCRLRWEQPRPRVRVVEGRRRDREDLMRRILTGAAIASTLLIGSAAWAQTGGSSGTTTGPAAGTNVQPSTATQKQ